MTNSASFFPRSSLKILREAVPESGILSLRPLKHSFHQHKMASGLETLGLGQWQENTPRIRLGPVGLSGVPTPSWAVLSWKAKRRCRPPGAQWSFQEKKLSGPCHYLLPGESPSGLQRYYGSSSYY